MVDLLRDSNGDLDLTENLVTLVENVEQLVKQRLEIRLFTNRGEWKFNAGFGMPWLTESGEQQLLGKTDQSFFDSVVKETILQDPYVIEIRSYSSNWDRNLGIYVVSASVVTPVGNIVELTLEGEI